MKRTGLKKKEKRQSLEKPTFCLQRLLLMVESRRLAFRDFSLNRAGENSSEFGKFLSLELMPDFCFCYRPSLSRKYQRGDWKSSPKLKGTHWHVFGYGLSVCYMKFTEYGLLLFRSDIAIRNKIVVPGSPVKVMEGSYLVNFRDWYRWFSYNEFVSRLLPRHRWKRWLRWKCV